MIRHKKMEIEIMLHVTISSKMIETVLEKMHKRFPERAHFSLNGTSMELTAERVPFSSNFLHF